MRGLPAELLFVLLFVGAILFQVLIKRRAGRDSRAPSQEGPVAEDMPAAFDSEWLRDEAAPVASSPPDVSFEPPAAARAASPARPLRRFSRQALMGTRRDVQNAVVIATILGPCRSLESAPAEASASPPRRAVHSRRRPSAG